MKIRVKFAKTGNMRFIGHLDILRYFQKAFQRAKLPLRFTEGFHPHPVLSFASPLGVGLTSEGEYFDTELVENMDCAEIRERLNAQMSEGMAVLAVIRLVDTEKKRNNNAMALVGQAEYQVRLRKAFSHQADWEETVHQFLMQEKIPVLRCTKRNTEEVNIRPLIYEMRAELEPDTFFLRISAGSAANLRPETVLDALLHFTHSQQFPGEGDAETEKAENGNAGTENAAEQTGSAMDRAGKYEICRLDILTAEGIPLGEAGKEDQ